jgi:hypothetical protein
MLSVHILRILYLEGVQFETQQKKIIVARDSCKKLLEVGRCSFEILPDGAVQTWKVSLNMLSRDLIVELLLGSNCNAV